MATVSVPGSLTMTAFSFSSSLSSSTPSHSSLSSSPSPSASASPSPSSSSALARSSSSSTVASSVYSHSSFLVVLILLSTVASSSSCIPLASAATTSGLATQSFSLPPVPALHSQVPSFLPSKKESVSKLLVESSSLAQQPPLQKRQPGPAIIEPTNPASTTTTAASTTKTYKPKTTMSTASTSTGSAVPTPSTGTQVTQAPDSKGDTALFGKPSVIGGYNLTSGILIYGAFLLLFLVAVGAATWQRAKYRDQFRKQQNKMESGKVSPSTDGGHKSRRGGGGTNDAELSDAALFKQASISKRALMKDVGPRGVLAANEAVKTKIAAANGAGRSFEDRQQLQHQQQPQSSVRFGEGNAPLTSGSRTGGMKKTTATNARGMAQDDYEMNSYGQVQDPLSYYQDNHDTTDYSRPPLTESQDPYYSSGSSHSGYLDQVEDYHNPSPNGNNSQAAQSGYQQSSDQQQSKIQPPIFVQRTNSSRMPQTDLHDGNNILRTNSGQRQAAGTPTRNGSNGGSRANAPGAPAPGRITTQGLLDRSGSGGSSKTNSSIDGGMTRNLSNASSTRTRVAPSPTLMHPTPIARSNSSRLPPSMRGGGANGGPSGQQGPSGLSQQTNNYDYM